MSDSDTPKTHTDDQSAKWTPPPIDWRYRLTRPAVLTVILSLAIIIAGVLASAATISHGASISLRPAILAIGVTLFGILPPLQLSRLIANPAGKQLSVVAWRLAIMLPALAIGSHFVAEERKCYLNTLLACYFVALPLESGLLIVDAKQIVNSAPKP